MTKNIGWDLYRSFLGVMQEGSLSASARALDLTQPTIGRHITELERLLKVTLFIRTQSGLIPTNAANDLLSYATEMRNVAEAMERVVTNQNGSVLGTVRVATSDVIGVEVLPKVLSQLGRSHPNLNIELMLSDKPQDLLSREADIAIRLFRPRQAQLIARRIGNIDLGFYAHKTYLAQQGSPVSVKELKNHTLIGFDNFTDYIRETIKKLPITVEKKFFTFRTDSNIAQLALIRAGAGIGICQVPLADRDNNLIRVLSDDFLIKMEAWVTMHEDLKKNPACQIVFNELAAGLFDYVESTNN